jgi:hypothetical protein
MMLGYAIPESERSSRKEKVFSHLSYCSGDRGLMRCLLHDWWSESLSRPSDIGTCVKSREEAVRVGPKLWLRGGRVLDAPRDRCPPRK